MTDTERANTILAVCCESYGTTLEEVSGSKRLTSDVRVCRLMIAELINVKAGLTHERSAALVNRKTCCITARIKRAGEMLGMSGGTRRDLEKLKSRLTELGV